PRGTAARAQCVAVGGRTAPRRKRPTGARRRVRARAGANRDPDQRVGGSGPENRAARPAETRDARRQRQSDRPRRNLRRRGTAYRPDWRSDARLAFLPRPALGLGTRRWAARDGGADRVRPPRGALSLPRCSGEREREREVIAADCHLDGVEHPRVRAHEPQAAHRQRPAERREEQGSLDHRLTPGRPAQPWPDHGVPSTWFTNTADPPPWSSTCSAMDTLPFPFVNTRSPAPDRSIRST